MKRVVISGKECMFLKLCLITADVYVCEVAGLWRNVTEAFALPEYYAAYVDRWLPTFRECIGPIFKHHSSWTV